MVIGGWSRNINIPCKFLSLLVRTPPPPTFGTSTPNRPSFSPPSRPPGPYGQYPTPQVTTPTGQAPSPSASQGFNGYGTGQSR